MTTDNQITLLKIDKFYHRQLKNFMQKFILKISFLTILSFFLLTSCEEDGTTIRPPVSNPTGPSISLVTGTNQVTNSTTIATGSTFTVQISAQAGEAFLEVLTIQKNGVNVPLANLSYSLSDFSANPALILNADYQTGLNVTVQIATSADANGTDTYSFEIKDENDLTATTDVAITYESLPPTSQFVEEAPFFWEDKFCPLGATFNVKILAAKGSANLDNFAVFENNELLTDLSRIKINGIDLLNNPTNIDANNAENLDFEVSITTLEDFFGTFTYEFVITDESGEQTSQLINVTVGTGVTELTGKLLFNQGGGAGTGGLNLFTGEGIGSKADSAYIKDEGIDTDLVATDNWLQQISGVNGSTIRIIDETQVEGFSFDNILLKEELFNLFDTGISLSGTNKDNEPVTDKITGGELFIIENGVDYFAIRMDRVVVTPDNNADFYELTIKY